MYLRTKIFYTYIYSLSTNESEVLTAVANERSGVGRKCQRDDGSEQIRVGVIVNVGVVGRRNRALFKQEIARNKTIIVHIYAIFGERHGCKPT